MSGGICYCQHQQFNGGKNNMDEGCKGAEKDKQVKEEVNKLFLQ